MENLLRFWNGGPLPTISSPLYLPIADEIAERLAQPGNEVPQGDPWTVRVPTNLVKLRADDALPVWKQNADGEWVEAGGARRGRAGGGRRWGASHGTRASPCPPGRLSRPSSLAAPG